MEDEDGLPFVQVPEPPTGRIMFVDVDSTVLNSTLAIDSSGNLWSWGSNGSGHLSHSDAQVYPEVEATGDLIEQVKRATETEYERSE